MDDFPKFHFVTIFYLRNKWGAKKVLLNISIYLYQNVCGISQPHPFLRDSDCISFVLSWGQRKEHLTTYHKQR
jgi:hypothetical protein